MDAQIVGSRRNAFLRAAPVIAKRHPFYRNSLVKRLRGTLLYNQDRATRELTAESLKRIIDGNEDDVAMLIREETSNLATVKESRVAHGSLLLLSKLCEKCGSPNLKVEVRYLLVAFIRWPANPPHLFRPSKLWLHCQAAYVRADRLHFSCLLSLNWRKCAWCSCRRPLLISGLWTTRMHGDASWRLLNGGRNLHHTMLPDCWSML